MLDGYREREGLALARGIELTKRGHTELQAETLKFVGDLREWLAARRLQDGQRQHQQWVAMVRATDETQKKQLWDAHTGDIIAASTSMNSEYDAKFKVRAIVLRDELLTRVKHPDPQSSTHRIYEHPTNPIGMGMVADDLERMARLLR
jgi:hypothetical protein